MICFGDRVDHARGFEIDSAVAVLEGLAELSQHHPALAPEIAAIRKISEGWAELVDGAVVRRHGAVGNAMAEILEVSRGGG